MTQTRRSMVGPVGTYVGRAVVVKHEAGVALSLWNMRHAETGSHPIRNAARFIPQNWQASAAMLGTVLDISLTRESPRVSRINTFAIVEDGAKTYGGDDAKTQERFEQTIRDAKSGDASDSDDTYQDVSRLAGETNDEWDARHDAHVAAWDAAHGAAIAAAEQEFGIRQDGSDALAAQRDREARYAAQLAAIENDRMIARLCGALVAATGLADDEAKRLAAAPETLAAALTLAGTFVRAADMRLEQLGQACDTRN